MGAPIKNLIAHITLLVTFNNIAPSRCHERHNPLPSSQTAVVKAEHGRDREQSESDFAYTIAAARRSEQRRLLAFIRMSDYRICDTLHGILLETAHEVRGARCNSRGDGTRAGNMFAAACSGKDTRRARRQGVSAVWVGCMGNAAVGVGYCMRCNLRT